MVKRLPKFPKGRPAAVVAEFKVGATFILVYSDRKEKSRFAAASGFKIGE